MNKLLQRFMSRKAVIGVLGKDHQLSDKQMARLILVFDYYGSLKKIEDMFKTVAIMVKYDLTNYKGRLRRLKGIPGTSKYTTLLRYGKCEYRNVYADASKRKTRHFQNKKQYWIEREYTEKEAAAEVNRVQKERSNKSPVVTNPSSEYSCRSILFWLKKGYSHKKAEQTVREIQTTNGIQYYLGKGLSFEESKITQNERTIKWQQEICKIDQKLLALKKGHSIESYMANGYSEEEALRKSIAYYKKRSRVSAISQEMFDMVCHRENLSDVFYESMNREYQLNGKLVDFFHAPSGTVVEFYGDFWHRNPKHYEPIFESHGISTEHVWKNDENRINKIKEHSKVQSVLIIWESDFRHNPEECIAEIILEIKWNLQKKKLL